MLALAAIGGAVALPTAARVSGAVLEDVRLPIYREDNRTLI
jgi:hypothetical protein